MVPPIALPSGSARRALPLLHPLSVLRALILRVLREYGDVSPVQRLAR